MSSALKRARATLARQLPPQGQAPPPPHSAVEQQLVARLTQAFEAADVDGIVALLTEDAWLTMPPVPLEYQGRELAGGSSPWPSGRGAATGWSPPGPTASPRSGYTSAIRTARSCTRTG